MQATATNDILQKKMIYNFIVYYAESRADLAMMTVNTLQKEACDQIDPMVNVETACRAPTAVVAAGSWARTQASGLSAVSAPVASAESGLRRVFCSVPNLAEYVVHPVTRCLEDVRTPHHHQNAQTLNSTDTLLGAGKSVCSTFSGARGAEAVSSGPQSSRT